ncbi:MAG: hypothetical protein K2K83_02320, partial [Rikenella sp.]|nr:hypothetical protein [Rikenella sp.]
LRSRAGPRARGERAMLRIAITTSKSPTKQTAHRLGHPAATKQKPDKRRSASLGPSEGLYGTQKEQLQSAAKRTGIQITVRFQRRGI